MGSQTTARQDAAGTDRQVPRMRRPASPLVPDALGRAVNRTDRLDALMRELQEAGPRGRTSAWLAERLNVSARTVKRDVTALQQAGVPIRASSGPQGGYAIDDAAPSASPGLSADEATAIVVSLQATADQPFAAHARDAVAKVLRALTADQRAEVARQAGHVWIRPGEPQSAADATVRDVLIYAARERRVVLLDYAPGGDTEARTLQVETLGFAHSLDHWFVLTWCREFESGQWFRLDHITAAQSTHETFAERDVRETFGGYVSEVEAEPATG